MTAMRTTGGPKRPLENGDDQTDCIPLGAALCVPLAVRGQLAGFLTLGAKRDRDLFSPAEKEALLAIADRQFCPHCWGRDGLPDRGVSGLTLSPAGWRQTTSPGMPSRLTTGG